MSTTVISQFVFGSRVTGLNKGDSDDDRGIITLNWDERFKYLNFKSNKHPVSKSYKDGDTDFLAVDFLTFLDHLMNTPSIQHLCILNTLSNVELQSHITEVFYSVNLVGMRSRIKGEINARMQSSRNKDWVNAAYAAGIYLSLRDCQSYNINMHYTNILRDSPEMLEIIDIYKSNLYLNEYDFNLIKRFVQQVFDCNSKQTFSPDKNLVADLIFDAISEYIE